MYLLLMALEMLAVCIMRLLRNAFSSAGFVADPDVQSAGSWAGGWWGRGAWAELGRTQRQQPGLAKVLPDRWRERTLEEESEVGIWGLSEGRERVMDPRTRAERTSGGCRHGVGTGRVGGLPWPRWDWRLGKLESGTSAQSCFAIIWVKVAVTQIQATGASKWRRGEWEPSVLLKTDGTLMSGEGEWAGGWKPRCLREVRWEIPETVLERRWHAWLFQTFMRDLVTFSQGHWKLTQAGVRGWADVRVVSHVEGHDEGWVWSWKKSAKRPDRLELQKSWLKRFAGDEDPVQEFYCCLVA